MKIRCILALLLPVACVFSQPQPDLSVASLTATVNTDPQTLVSSGSLSVTVRNTGPVGSGTGFQIVAFEDRNGNRRLDSASDNVLGMANVAAALASGATTDVNISVSGSLLFAGNILYVAADSNNVVIESDETNNLRHTGQNSVFTGPAETALNPVLKWMAGDFTELPDRRSTLATPTVGDVNGDGIPDVVFPTGAGVHANVRVVSGDTGEVIYTIVGLDLEVSGQTSITLADIDDDGRAELVTVDRLGRLIAFEHDGTLKWRASVGVPGAATGPIVADLEGDGTPEVVVGNHVYSSVTGARLWNGTGGAGHGAGGHVASVVADLDLDGSLEVVAGPTAYRADGTIHWNKLNTPATLQDGPVAVANFDADPNPEFVIRPYNSTYLYMLEHDGTVKWGVTDPMHETWGGQPVIGDVDNDAVPEIAVVDRAHLYLYKADGSLKWSIPIMEHTSGWTSATIFDLNNDDAAEVVYADEQKLYILRGSDGAILNEFVHYSSTSAEGVTIADTDLDGHAEILVVGDVPFFPEGRALRVFTGANNNWANTRPLWNQDGNTITNINDDLSVPAKVTPNWLTPGMNNYRTNGFLPNSFVQPNSAPDITVSLLRRLDANFPASVSLVARIGNGGSLVAPIHHVEFRNGAGGTLLGAVDTSRPLNPGEYEDVAIVWAAPPAGQLNLVVSADTNNIVVEGDEANNLHGTQLVIGQGPYVTVDDLIPRGKQGGADLKWTQVPGAVSYNIYRRTDGEAQALIRGAYVTSNGSFSDQSLVNNTRYYYEIRWLDAQGQESHPGTEASVQPVPRRQRSDRPPSILSSPPTRGRTGIAYSYIPSATDPDSGEVLTWQIAGAPAGMTLNGSAGQLDWLPGAGQGGSFRLTLTVTDTRGRIASQAFTLFIETQLVNTAPGFLSTPLTSGVLGRTYSYAARAADPDAGDALTFLLDGAPPGMTVHASTGLIQWTPTATGAFPVVLRVRDLAGETAAQTFTVAVANLNRGPQITSVPPDSATAEATYSYTATATDPDAGDTISWMLVQAPAGMTLNPATGVILWTPALSQVGVHPLTIEVRDTLGEIAEESWVISVANAVNINSPPVITSAAPTSTRVGIPYLYDVNAVDPEGSAVTHSLGVAPAGASIDVASGLISWTPLPTDVGDHSFTMEARDSAGQSSTQSFVVTVIDIPPAIFTLISPAIGADLTGPVNIVASISDPNAGGPVITWSVKLRKPGMADRLLSSGTGPVSNGTIGSIDPTVLSNDSYSVVVQIMKGVEGITREIPYTISGNLKLGQFRSSMTDLSIPLAGVPLSIVRVYDSLDTRTGDFGAGWRLSVFGGVADASSEAPLEGLRPGGKVYVTTPDGRRVGFRFDPVATSTLFPWVVTPHFLPDAGVQDTLEVAETSVFLFDGIAYVDFLNVWNPSRYILTTREGVRYEVDETAGVQLIRDRNGNTITFLPSAIVSSTGVQITLTRDAEGRITSIRDPGGSELRYAYDAAGNLASSVDALGRTSRYFYEHLQFPNYLTRMEDPLGRSLVRNVYGADGRLTASCPPTGNISTLEGCTQLTHDAAALTQTIVNGRGFRRDYVYDERGNLVTERRFLDAATSREIVRTYDAADNLLTERDPEGNITRYTYDSAGNVLSRTDSAGRTTTATYNADCNLPATITDPAGGVETYTYDSLCQLRFVTDRAARTREYRYDASGNQTHSIDAQGAATIRTFNAQGLPLTIRDPRGNPTTLTWSAAGELLSKVDRNGRRIDYEYDATHAVTRETWSDGRVIQYAYDAFGMLTSASDPAASLAFEYDGLGRRTRAETTYPGETPFAIDYSYDPNNNRTGAVDSAGGSTQSTFDGLDQLTSIAQSGTGINAKSVRFSYNLAGLPVSIQRFADLAGATPVASTGIEYECGGCAGRTAALRHTNPAATMPLQIFTFGRNVLGDVTQMTDNQGLHLFEYDPARQLTRAGHPNPAIQPDESYTYDAAGNRLSSHLDATETYSYQSGSGGNLLLSDAEFDYTYDAEGNLTHQRKRADASTLEYQYDFRNRVMAIIARSGAGVETGRNMFTYDALNRRISLGDSSGTTHVYYDLLHPILSIAPGNAVTRRLYGPRLDEILAADVSGQTRWLLTDQVGTVRTIVGNDGAVMSELVLDSFGRPLSNSNPGVSSELAFTARERIPVSGDLNFRARLYSPRTGRFLQEDPWEPYAYDYALNSPLVRTDPLGLNAAPEYGFLNSQRQSFIGVLRQVGRGVCLGISLGVLVTGTMSGNAAALGEAIDIAEAVSIIIRRQEIQCP